MLTWTLAVWNASTAHPARRCVKGPLGRCILEIAVLGCRAAVHGGMEREYDPR